VTPAGRPLTFTVASQPRPLTLARCFARSSRLHRVLEEYSPEAWKARRAERESLEARRADIQRRTVDAVSAGDPDSEREHAFAGEATSEGCSRPPYRQANAGGWMAYDLKVTWSR